MRHSATFLLSLMKLSLSNETKIGDSQATISWRTHVRENGAEHGNGKSRTFLIDASGSVLLDETFRVICTLVSTQSSNSAPSQIPLLTGNPHLSVTDSIVASDNFMSLSSSAPPHNPHLNLQSHLHSKAMEHSQTHPLANNLPTEEDTRSSESCSLHSIPSCTSAPNSTEPSSASLYHIKNLVLSLEQMGVSGSPSTVLGSAIVNLASFATLPNQSQVTIGLLKKRKLVAELLILVQHTVEIDRNPFWESESEQEVEEEESDDDSTPEKIITEIDAVATLQQEVEQLRKNETHYQKTVQDLTEKLTRSRQIERFLEFRVREAQTEIVHLREQLSAIHRRSHRQKPLSSSPPPTLSVSPPLPHLSTSPPQEQHPRTPSTFSHKPLYVDNSKIVPTEKLETSPPKERMHANSLISTQLHTHKPQANPKKTLLSSLYESQQALIASLYSYQPPDCWFTTQGTPSAVQVICTKIIECGGFCDDSRNEQFLSEIIRALEDISELVSKDGERLTLLIVTTLWLLKFVSEQRHSHSRPLPGQIFINHDLLNFNAEATSPIDKFQHSLCERLVKLYDTLLKLIYKSIEDAAVRAFLPSIADFERNTTLQATELMQTAAINVLLSTLNTTLQNTDKCKMPAYLAHQLIRQIFYYINAVVMNNIFSNPNFCSVTCGSHMKLGVRPLSEWSSNLCPVAQDMIRGLCDTAKLLLSDKLLLPDVPLETWFPALTPRITCYIISSFRDIKWNPQGPREQIVIQFINKLSSSPNKQDRPFSKQFTSFYTFQPSSSSHDLPPLIDPHAILKSLV
ncbi:hypothetical protein Pelo_3781 [Pelomyxa schiedti]|nr:hypothetical protein Pelo_3781 [Pelomyxa schiedti]